MPAAVVAVPFLKRSLYGTSVFELRLPLEIQTAPTTFVSLPFLVDTGTHLTTIPIAEARWHSIPFAMNRPVFISGPTGRGSLAAYLSPLWFSFSALPHWQFKTLACFSPYTLPRSLLSLSAILPNFVLRTGPRTALHADGSLILRLRRSHHERPRA